MSLEILQTPSKLTPNSVQTQIFYFFVFFLYCFFWKKDWVWSEFGDSPNSLQTQVQSHFFSVFTFFLKKMTEFGVSLEILQTLSKLGPNSNISIFLCFFYFNFFVEKKRLNLESPNSLQTHSKLGLNSRFWFFLFSFLIFGKLIEFGVSLGILQTFPNSLQSRSKLSNLYFLFFFFCIFFEKTDFGSKLFPNSFQTQICWFVCFFLFHFF